MSRSLFVRGLIVVVSTVFVIGCGAGTPTEGNLPPTKVATKEEMENLQKEIIAKKMQGPAAAEYKAPPGVQKPAR